MPLPLQKFKFTRDFQIGIIAYMVQSFEFLVLANDIIEAEFFEDAVLIWYFQTVLRYFTDYQQKPNLLVLENELKKANAAKIIKDHELPVYKQLLTQLVNPIDVKDYVVAEVVRFCRRQAVRKAMIELAPLTDSQDDEVWAKIEGTIQTACSVGSQAMDLGIQYFIDYPERLRSRIMGEDLIVVPTGITELDNYISGGLKSGQLGIWLGGTSAGKSLALSHCGKRAVVQGLKVIHYTCELSAEEIAERYDSSWSHVTPHELIPKNDIVETKLTKLGRKYGNSLIIKYYPAGTATVGTLRAHLLTLKAADFIPDLIIVDYGDLLKPTTSYQNEYSDLGVIFRDLHGLAGEMHVPLWTASQTNRTGLNVEVVDLEHIGDSLRKVQIANVVIGMCRTREEYEAGIMRLFIAKNKNGPEKVTVTIRTAYKRMAFYLPAAPPVTNSFSTANANPPPKGPRRVPKTKGVV